MAVVGPSQTILKPTSCPVRFHCARDSAFWLSNRILLSHRSPIRLVLTQLGPSARVLACRFAIVTPGDTSTAVSCERL